MAKKKFGANGLNAVDVATETVMASVADNIVSSSITVESAHTPAPEPEVIATPTSVPTTVVERKKKQDIPQVDEAPVVPVQPIEQPVTAPQSKVEEPEVKVENTKGLNILLPESIYKRLSMMKLDSADESLKSLGLKAIIEFLDKNGY